MITPFLKVLALGIVGFGFPKPGFAIQGLMDPMGAMRKMKVSAAMLTALPGVKKDLKLSGEQVKKIDSIRKDFEKSLGSLAQGGSPMGAFEEMQAAIAKADADVAAALQPEQALRLRSLQYQALGAKALYEKDLQKTLELTPEQIVRIDAAKAGENSRMRDIFSGVSGSSDGRAMQKKLKASAEENERQILAILTPDQTTRYRATLGPLLKDVAKLADGGL